MLNLPVWKTSTVALLLLASFIPSTAQKPVPQSASPTPPRVFLFNAQQLATLRAADPNDPHRQEVLRAATAAADRAMKEGPFAVTQKTATPPSGDKHDYMSQAPYFWPDPNKPNGLPYIRRDGQHNPEIQKITDHEEFGQMGRDTRALGLAYYLTGNAAYADRAALLLRTWFLDPATKMNPNLEFAQAIPGVNTGRGTGIIESRALADVTDACGLLIGSKAWTAVDERGIEDWFTQYLHWMTTSDHGKAEDAARNNHGSWYDLQIADGALFVGNQKLAIDTLERVKTRRIAIQIEPDGREPLELARTNAWGYSNFNLSALIELAMLGDEAGVDLWNFKTSDGRSIRTAVDFLLPYAAGEKKWDYQQIGGFSANAMLSTLLRAANAYHDPKYAALAAKLRDDREDLETLLLSGE
jgi:hypothetical protein